jgi:photosystem II stability/assembly factor-like uncharacterized protein
LIVPKPFVFRRLAALFLSTGIFGWAASWTEINLGLPHKAVGAATIISDPRTPATIYAISTAGSLFKSTDGSANWRSISGVTAVSSLVIDPTNSSIVYAATSHGVVKSVDGGGSWLGANRGLSSSWALVAIDPSHPAILYAQTQTGLFTTVDGGQSWNPLDAKFYVSVDSNAPLPNPQVTAIFVDPSRPSTLYATYTNGFSGVFKSTDGGTNWSAIIAGTALTMWDLKLAIDPVTSSTIYVSYVDLDRPLDHAQSHILKSVDAGATWQEIDTGIPLGSVASLLVDPAATSTIYTGYHSITDSSWGIAKSVDGGKSWKRSDTDLPVNYNFVSLALETAASSTLYSSYLDYQTGVGGIFKSTDGGASWQAANAGPGIIEITALAADPVNPDRVYISDGYDGIFQTVDHGESWKGLAALRISTASPNGVSTTVDSAPALTLSLAVDSLHPAVLYAWTYSGTFCRYADNLLFRSTNGGIDWSDTASPPENPCVFGGFLVIDPTDPKTLYVSESDFLDGGYWLRKSSDGGVTWAYVWNRYDFGVDSLVIDPKNNSTLFAGTSSGVFKSTDGGATWISPAQQFGVGALAIDPVHPGIVYAVANQAYPAAGSVLPFWGLLKTSDGGATWSAMNNGLASVIDSGSAINALAISPDDTKVVYAATAGYGVFRSLDGGANWAPLNEGLTNLDVRLLALAPSAANVLYAGTTGGMFAITVAPVTNVAAN